MTEIGFGKLGKMGSLDLSRLKSGVKKTDLQNDVQKSIFDKVDKNGNGVLEEGEVNALSQSLQELAGKDNNISDKEAQNFFKQNNMQDVESQQLYEFVSQLGVDSDKIDNASKQTMKDGTEAVVVQYKPDDTGTTNTDFMNSDTGEVVAKKSENEQTEVFTEYENGNVKTKTTTDKAANTTTTENFIEGGGGGLPSSKTTVYGDSGATETIKYEGGKPATKEVSRGTVQQHYSTDENGEFRLDSETKQIGPEMEEKSTHTYINNNEIIETTLPGDKTRTQVKTDGKLMSETNTQTGRSETVTYDESGKTTSKTILKGSNFENPDVKNQITYNKDGSRTESFEQPAKGIQITDHYNNKGFKTKETAVVNGKTYTATYDGKGHGTLTMKAGETVESFAQRTGCPVSEINRLNQFPGGVPQAGQQIKVPEKYVKATDSNNFAVNKNAEKAKGNAAEEQRVENTMGKLSNVYEQKNTKGKYQSYNDYTSRLIQNEVKNGTLPESALNDKNLHKELSQKIKNLNGGADIKSLDSIKCPVSSSYNTKLKNVEKQQEQKKNEREYMQIALDHTKQKLAAAKADFEAQMNKDGLYADAADTISKLWNNHLYGDALGINTGNTASQIREQFQYMENQINKMEAALKKGDVKTFQRIRSEVSNNPKTKDIIETVNNYNESQDTGATAVEFAVDGAALFVPGGQFVAGAVSVADKVWSNDTRAKLAEGDVGTWAQTVGEAALHTTSVGAGKLAGSAIGQKVTSTLGKNIGNFTGKTGLNISSKAINGFAQRTVKNTVEETFNYTVDQAVNLANGKGVEAPSLSPMGFVSGEMAKGTTGKLLNNAKDSNIVQKFTKKGGKYLDKALEHGFNATERLAQNTVQEVTNSAISGDSISTTNILADTMTGTQTDRLSSNQKKLINKSIKEITKEESDELTEKDIINGANVGNSYYEAMETDALKKIQPKRT